MTIRKAIKEDCVQALELIKELAKFEKAAEEVDVDLTQFMEDGFGKNPSYFMFVAEVDKVIVGIALCYEKYSTWKGRCTFLEDLIVTQSMRGKGIGKALFEQVIKHAAENNSGRLEWQVLDWNESAIGFYQSYGAEIDDSWLNGRFRREQLKSMKF